MENEHGYNYISWTDVARQRIWSDETFGPGTRLKGVIAHIKKELVEVEEKPDDVRAINDAAGEDS